MTIISNNFHLVNDIDNFKELIFFPPTYGNNFTKSNPIISIAVDISPVDPLMFFAVMKQPNSLSFYWENQGKNEAIVALGAMASFELTSSSNYNNSSKNNRFFHCQKFIENITKSIVYKDNFNNKSYFFTYFKFFHDTVNNQSIFPSATVFLPYIQLYKKNNNYQLIIHTDREKENLIKNYLHKDIIYFINEKSQYLKDNQDNFKGEIEGNNYQEFIDKVTKGLEEIRRGRLNKIVVAHTLEVKIKEKFKIINSLYNLRNNHPDCYIFAVGNEDNNYFIGASPERLLSIQDNQLVSDALAGSAPRGKDDHSDYIIGDKLLTSEKEKREHEVVSNFIFNQLSEMRLNPKKAPLQLLKLSNIQHLWTPIYAEIKTTINPLEIIEKLHPTPAVAGDPVEVACLEIKASEKFDRHLYASPIGWLDIEGNCEFIVGIRSALIKDNYACLYAGAGIVKGSKPEQELKEIQLKFQALLHSLN